MTDIDTIARCLAEDISVECGCSMPSVNDWVVTDWIRKSLQSYGDACAKQMREEALEQVKYRLNVFGGEPTTLNERSILNHVSRAILAIPLHSEKVKP